MRRTSASSTSPNDTGVIFTTNYELDGPFVAGDDRRHYVAWSDVQSSDFPPGYFDGLWRWLMEEGGAGHVAAYLHALDLSTFNPEAPPLKTEAFWRIVNTFQPREAGELADVLDALGSPNAVTLDEVVKAVTGGITVEDGRQVIEIDSEFAAWLQNRGNAARIPHRFRACGYVGVRNPDASDGVWRDNQKRKVVYAKRGLSQDDQVAAIKAKNFPDKGG